MTALFGGFKDFIMRGNVVELAVAVVIGTAFTALVNGIVEGLLNPLVALVAGRADLSQVGAFTVGGTDFRPGLAIDALITFLLVSGAVYFFIVVPLKRVTERQARDDAAVAEVAPLAPDLALLAEIRDLLAGGAAPSAVPAAPRADDGAPPRQGPSGR